MTTDPERLTWSPFVQWRERHQPAEPEPDPDQQPETDAGPITPDPDQGKTGGTVRRPPDMNRLIRRAWQPEDPRFR